MKLCLHVLSCAYIVTLAADEGTGVDSMVLVQTRLDVRIGQMKAKSNNQDDDLLEEFSPDVHQQVKTLSKYRQTMQNYGNAEYVAHVYMGNQKIAGMIDTGSFELVVFSTSCENCSQAGTYVPQRSDSHTLGSLVATQSYGNGDTQSSQASDMLSIGTAPARRQSFWEVASAAVPVLEKVGFQAIIGVGPPETPAADAWAEAQLEINNINHIFNNGTLPGASLVEEAKASVDAALVLSTSTTMLENFHIHTFSVCLGAESGADGALVWNDTSIFETPSIFKRLSVLGRHTWSVQLSNVQLTSDKNRFTLGCTSTSTSRCSVLIDSGTSLIAVPQAAADKLQHFFRRVELNCSDLRGLPNLAFELGGHAFSLPPDAYVAATVPAEGASAGTCKLAVMVSTEESRSGPVWILGMPFFRKYYTSFHLGKSLDSRSIYVARASQDCSPSEFSTVRSLRHARRLVQTRLHGPPIIQSAGNRSHPDGHKKRPPSNDTIAT